MGQFLPEYLRAFSANVDAPKKLIAISNTKNATEIVYLEKIVKEFDRKLKQKVHKEQEWQEFPRDYILIFNNKLCEQLGKGKHCSILHMPIGTAPSCEKI